MVRRLGRVYCDISSLWRRCCGQDLFTLWSLRRVSEAKQHVVWLWIVCFHWIFNDEDIDVSVGEEEDIVSRRATHGRWGRERRSSEEADVDSLSPKVFESDTREQLPWTRGSYNFHNIQTHKLFVVSLLNESSLSWKISLQVTCSAYFTIQVPVSMM